MALPLLWNPRNSSPRTTLMNRKDRLNYILARVSTLALAAIVQLGQSARADETNEDKNWPVPTAGVVIKTGTNTFVAIKDVGVVKVGNAFSITNDAGVFDFRLVSWNPNGMKCEKIRNKLNPPPATVQSPGNAEEKPKEEGPRNPFDPVSAKTSITSRIENVEQPQ